MDTSQLECFVQVALNLSFRRAAEELHLSQPTVSKRIGALEADLGGALFVRSTRQVMLTALGESFLRDAQEILRLAYAAEERARRQSMGNDLVIAYSDGNELMRLEPVLDALRRTHEGLHVLLRQGPRDSNVTRLSREQVDLVLGYETKALVTGGISFTRLAETGLSCVVPLGSALSRLESIGPEDVAGLPQVLCLPPSVRRHGMAAQPDIPVTEEAITTRCATSSEAYCLVDAGFGYALVPSLLTMPDPYHRVLGWRGRTSAWYGVYHRTGSRGGLVPLFLQTARELYSSQTSAWNR